MTTEEILRTELELSKTFIDIYRRSFELCNKHLAASERQCMMLMNENDEWRRKYLDLLNTIEEIPPKRIE